MMNAAAEDFFAPAFALERFYAQKFFAQQSLCTAWFSNAEACTERGVPDKLSHREAFTHRNKANGDRVDAQKLLHTKVLTYRSHRGAFTQRSFIDYTTTDVVR